MNIIEGLHSLSIMLILFGSAGIIISPFLINEVRIKGWRVLFVVFFFVCVILFFLGGFLAGATGGTE